MFNTNKLQKTCKYGLAVTTMPPPAVQLRTWLCTVFKWNISYLKKNNIVTKYTGSKNWNSTLTKVAKKLRCEKSVSRKSPGLHDPWGLSLSCNLLGTLQQSVVDIFGTGDLRLDHAEVLGIRHGLCLHRVGLGGGWDQVGWMFGAVDALGETLVRQSLNTQNTQNVSLCNPLFSDKYSRCVCHLFTNSGLCQAAIV